MRRALVIATLLCTVVLDPIIQTVHSSPPSENRRDGNWWVGQTEILKLNYIVWFFDGMDLGHKFSYWKFSHDKQKSACLADIISSYSEFSDKYFTNVTNDQLVD